MGRAEIFEILPYLEVNESKTVVLGVRQMYSRRNSVLSIEIIWVFSRCFVHMVEEMHGHVHEIWIFMLFGNYFSDL